jgi:5'-nucleotidase/UDP-sugar diphosphatase
MPYPINRREFLRRLLLAAGGAALSGCRTRQPASGNVVPITVLHVNDFHGALYAKSEEGGERGGAANLIGLIERKRADAPGPVILLDAGDAFQGTYVSNSNRGQAMIELMNLAGVAALTLGNHEFDWGLDVLRARVQEAQFPCLAANLETDSGEMLAGVAPYTVVDAGGIQVGILGLTYHDLRTIVKASAIEGIHSLDPVETVRRYLPELQQQSDLAIVLSHLGYEADVALAEAVPEIPIIVGGHSHTALHSGTNVGDTLIVQAGANGQYLGQVQFAFDRGRGSIVATEGTTAHLVKVTDAGTPSAEARAIVEKWGKEAEEIGEQVIGEAAVPLKRSRNQETALGNLIADAMRATDLGDGRTADIAMHNDGGIRTDLDAGPITYAEIYAVLPFDNSLVGLDLTGAQVREMLENGLTNSGSQIQVSGLTFSYSLNKSNGRRVMDTFVGGERLDTERSYRVVTIDYLYTNPEYELSLGLGTNVTYGGLCLDAVIDHIRANSPVKPQVEGRIEKM